MRSEAYGVRHDDVIRPTRAPRLAFAPTTSTSGSAPMSPATPSAGPSSAGSPSSFPSTATPRSGSSTSAAATACSRARSSKSFPTAGSCCTTSPQPMFDQARERLGPLAERVEFAQGDLRDPKWVDGMDGPFDAVVSSIAIHNVRDPERIKEIYGEIRPLVAPGGCFANLDIVFHGGLELEIAARVARRGRVPGGGVPPRVRASSADGRLQLTTDPFGEPVHRTQGREDPAPTECDGQASAHRRSRSRPRARAADRTHRIRTRPARSTPR